MASYAEGYLEHYGAQPGNPFANSVSSYHRMYNWLWFNNGYHAEHHYRPRMHWTKMREFHEQIIDQQKTAGVHVIKPPHALGFLDGQPARRSPAAPLPLVESSNRQVVESSSR
jgi:fatty acid desaturase